LLYAVAGREEYRAAVRLEGSGPFPSRRAWSTMNGIEQVFPGRLGNDRRMGGLRRLEEKEGIDVFDERSMDGFLSDAHVGAAVISPDLKVLWANSFFREVFGAAEGRFCHSVFFSARRGPAASAASGR